MDEEGHLHLMPCSFDFECIIVNHNLLEEKDIDLPKEWTLENLVKSCVEFTEKTRNEANIYAIY